MNKEEFNNIIFKKRNKNMVNSVQELIKNFVNYYKNKYNFIIILIVDKDLNLFNLVKKLLNLKYNVSDLDGFKFNQKIDILLLYDRYFNLEVIPDLVIVNNINETIDIKDISKLKNKTFILNNENKIIKKISNKNNDVYRCGLNKYDDIYAYDIKRDSYSFLCNKNKYIIKKDNFNESDIVNTLILVNIGLLFGIDIEEIINIV